MGVYDQAARYLAKRNPPGFFRWAVPRWLTSFAFTGWRDTSRITFPGEPDRICDTVAEFVPLAGTGPRRLLDGEFQTEPDADILERLGEYSLRLRRELRHGPGPAGKYQVVSLLVNLTGTAQDGTLDMTEEALDGRGMRLCVVVRTLRDEDAADTLAQIAAGELDRCVLPWVPLMAGAEDLEAIAEWKRLAEQESDPRWRSEYGALALVFVELTRWAPAWRQALEGWNVRESPQVLEWQLEAVLKNSRKKLLQVLEVRLKTLVPVDITAYIEAMSDPQILDRLFALALSVPNYDEFRRHLQT